MTGFRVQAAGNGAARVVGEMAAGELHIVQQPFLLGLKLLVDFVVPDVPDRIRIALHRAEFVADSATSAAAKEGARPAANA